MNLRPHHLLCIQKFSGHGYSEEFTANMESILSALAENPQITVTYGCDELCKMCPNKIGSTCNTPQKVDFMDSAVLRTCNLSYGDTVFWTVAADKAQKQILETDEFFHICANCQWFALCGGHT